MPGCGSAPLSPAPQLTLNACPAVTRCQLPAAAPRTNGALNLALERAEAAWAVCAAEVDMVYFCQQEADVQAKKP
ncbi:Rz1-like lysis system protein LysC [Collimonas sp. OK412]|uniref:Rz1-like lysis system protein LysC n=1 Tax=Collimonas sp. (strain OK412) TaxID=1801619 RepID=UPI0020C8BB58|nr:Rz1-like lysis system protein LysC [Collimonas sp. OK412]